MYSQFKEKTAKDVVSALLSNDTLISTFPNLSTLAMIMSVIPVTTCTVERSFSQMKLVKTRLRNRLGDDTLDMLMTIGIEGPKTLNDEQLNMIIELWKNQKHRRLPV